MPFDSQPVVDEKVIISSNLRAAREVEEQVLRAVQAQGCSPQCAFAIRLALEEALVNAHKHGNCSDSEKEIHVDYHISPERVVIRVSDQGQGFDPSAVPDPTTPDRISLPSGRGIMLMYAYMDEVTYSHRGNEVKLVKERP